MDFNNLTLAGLPKETEIIKRGKTKDVYELPDGNILLIFKDDATGANGTYDPGANQVIGAINGKAHIGVWLTQFFFSKLEKRGIPTHMIYVNTSENFMIVKPAQLFGDGLEFICRPYAAGSYLRRYGRYINEGDSAGYVFEVTLKDDKRDDPPINEDTLELLRLLKPGQYQELKSLTKKITRIIATELAEVGLVLIDIKLEFGIIDGRIVLIDEVSPDSWRIVDKNGNKVSLEDLAQLFSINKY